MRRRKRRRVFGRMGRELRHSRERQRRKNARVGVVRNVWLGECGGVEKWKLG